MYITVFTTDKGIKSSTKRQLCCVKGMKGFFMILYNKCWKEGSLRQKLNVAEAYSIDKSKDVERVELSLQEIVCTALRTPAQEPAGSVCFANDDKRRPLRRARRRRYLC
ncbi:hypothetical protein KQX54_021448 [Cotesia glomerata]|uniref:Uncharacterized protein n=1 Tax=Cotesia glomerata TaxID=32391 RepID=A0AAV7IVZ7_COTGL|nr:hypothetical protein KQX54_021448 [Cotesia glomerata]